MKAGVDEAGRGPVLGPMVMAIVAIRPSDTQLLNKIGVKDSKKVPATKRNKIAKFIKQHCPHVIIKVSPKEIDAALHKEGDSLNLLEARTTTKLINRLVKKTIVSEVMLDLPAKNKEEYLAVVCKKLTEQVPVDAKFKADETHIAAAAASILAKVTRDAAIRSFEKQLGIQLGSGYPSDPNTQRALKQNLPLILNSGIARKSWKTIQEASQSSLDRFL